MDKLIIKEAQNFVTLSFDDYQAIINKIKELIRKVNELEKKVKDLEYISEEYDTRKNKK
jgi:hypothetical protein